EDIVNASETLPLRTRGDQVMLDCSTPAKRHDAIMRLHNHLTLDVSEEDQNAVLRELAASCGVDVDAPRRAMLMNWEEIRAASRHPLVTIGAHTVNHRNLKRLSEQSARSELEDVQHILK